MITLVEALNYRCLRYISQPLGPFHVLVGPNASGKTTFLDVIAFLGRLVSDGPDAAIEERTQNFYDLIWQREGDRFELAIEAQIPVEIRERLCRPRWSENAYDTVRYEIVIALDPATQERGVERECLYLKTAARSAAVVERSYHENTGIPDTIFDAGKDEAARVVIEKNSESASFLAETSTDDEEEFRQTVRRSALQHLPPLEQSFPVSFWLKEALTSGLQQIALNSTVIRRPSPPGQGRSFRPDGSNLPWVVADLRQRSPERFRQWIAHLQTSFPDLEDIDTIERPEDRHRYLILQYSGGLKVPSWMASDGTLRMLALTLPAYLEDFKGIYLIEEPENGIHPRAIETMTQSLSSVYNAQVLMATHSPVVLSTVEAEQILCFSKNAEGATEIVRGSEHPALQEWKHETTLGTLFAAGVLG